MEGNLQRLITETQFEEGRSDPSQLHFIMQSFPVFWIYMAVTVTSYGYAPQAPPPSSSMQEPTYYDGYGNQEMDQERRTTHPMKHIQNANSAIPSPAMSGPGPQIIHFHHEIQESGSSNINYETSNGIRLVENSRILPGTPNSENPREVWNRVSKSGFYSYISPEGFPVRIDWVANGDTGFLATGSVIPNLPSV